MKKNDLYFSTYCTILRMVDFNVACMGFVYEGMDGTKGHIFPLCNNDQSIYKPIWDIMDKRWCMLHMPLHVAGLFLAPKYFHIPKDKETMDVFYSCMERMYLDPKIQDYIQVQPISYKQGECKICLIHRSPLRVIGGFSMDMRHLNCKHLQSG